MTVRVPIVLRLAKNGLPIDPRFACSLCQVISLLYKVIEVELKRMHSNFFVE
jgi:hypothetical protein